MTAKRFGLILYDNTIQVKEIRDNGKVIYPKEIVDLLNEFAEENEELKQRIKELKQEIEKLDKFKKILEYAEKESDRVDWQSYCEKEFEGL